MYFHLFQMGCNITTYLNLKGVVLCIIAFPPHIQMCPDQPRCNFLLADCVSGLWMTAASGASHHHYPQVLQQFTTLPCGRQPTSPQLCWQMD